MMGCPALESHGEGRTDLRHWQDLSRGPKGITAQRRGAGLHGNERDLKNEPTRPLDFPAPAVGGREG